MQNGRKKTAVRVSDGIQEALENVREIRATNQEERYLNGLNQKIDEHERVTIQGELGTGLFCKCRERYHAAGRGNNHSCRCEFDIVR